MRLIEGVLVVITTVLLEGSYQYDYIFEGEACRNSDGSQGSCLLAPKCTTLTNAIKAGMRPKICSFRDREAVLCCPPAPNSKPQGPPPTPPAQHWPAPKPQDDKFSRAVQVANQMCREYAKSVKVEIDSPVAIFGAGKEEIDRCALVEEALILGGEKAKPKEFPHMAQIGYGLYEDRISWLCGGSLISTRFVISAAHCSKPPSKGPARWVRLGDLDTSTDYDDASPQVIRIAQRIDHPQYGSKNLYNDITLFRLEEEVVLDAYVRPICLSTSAEYTVSTGLASGWGHTEWGGKGSKDLLKVRLGLVDHNTCYEKFKSSIGSKLPQGIIVSQVCAGDEVGKDTCQGDSGGPLQNPLKDPYCMYELIGLTSFGSKCGKGHPGVYTRISSFLPWIVDNVWPQ